MNTPTNTLTNATRNASDVARIALACLDLTSLNDADTEADIARLCERASGPWGHTAAVCVWPRLARFAREHTPAAIAVAAVANFPDGSLDEQRAVRDTAEIVQAGAQEVDVVLPYRALMAGDDSRCAALLASVRRASEGLRLKVILETGELVHPALIERASKLALHAGADFLKTSTGKTPVSATPEAAGVMLRAVRQHAPDAQRVGFKASGGIRSVADAAIYLDLVAAEWGDAALVPARFRIGASALLTDIERVLAGTPQVNAAPSKGY